MMAGAFCNTLRLRITELQEQFILLERHVTTRITATYLHYAVGDALLPSLFDADRAPSAHPQKEDGNHKARTVKRAVKITEVLNTADRYRNFAVQLLSSENPTEQSINDGSLIYHEANTQRGNEASISP